MTPRRMLQANQDPGSPLKGEPGFVVVGKLRRAHGVRGEMVMEIMTDFPERLVPHKVLYLGSERQPIKLRTVRDHDRYLLVSFEGRFDPEAVSDLRNLEVFVRTENLPELPEGQYYHHQLIGMAVVSDTGQPLGSLVEILETGSNDVYVVAAPDGTETLLPAVGDVILDVNVQTREMRVHPPEWE